MKRQITINFLFIFFFLTSLHAQEFTLLDHFDGLPNNDNTEDYYFEAISHQGEIYAAGTTRAINAQGNQGDLLLIAKYNNSGQRTNSATYGFSELFPTKLLSLANGNLLVTGQDADIGFIIILDTDLNVIAAENFDFVLTDIVENSDGSFTTVAGDDLIHIGTDLEVTSSVDLDSANFTSLVSIKSKGDNYMVLGMLTNPPSSSSGFPTSLYGAEDILVAELTTSGEVVWAKNYGGSNIDNVAFVNIDLGHLGEIIPTQDGNFIFNAQTKSANGDITQDFGNGDNDYDMWVVKIEPTGNIIWQAKLGTKANEFGARLTELSNGNIVAPVSLSAFNESQDVLSCTDCQGDVGWSCVLDQQTGAILEQNWIDGAGDEFISRWVENGDHLLGFGYSESNVLAGVELDDYDAIVVKWNLSTGTTPTKNLLTDAELQVYPNPSGDWIKLEFPKTTFFTQKQLLIYDLNGREMMSIMISSDDTVLDISSLATGHYSIKVGDEGSVSFVKK